MNRSSGYHTDTLCHKAACCSVQNYIQIPHGDNGQEGGLLLGVVKGILS